MPCNERWLRCSAGRLRITALTCCMSPLSGAACSTAGLTYLNTTMQTLQMQAGTTAWFSFQMTQAAAYYGGELSCNFNSTVNYQVRCSDTCPPAGSAKALLFLGWVTNPTSQCGEAGMSVLRNIDKIFPAACMLSRVVHAL